MNPYEMHPEDREKMKNKINKNKVMVSKLKEIISNYQKSFKVKKAPLWGYNKGHIDKIFTDIISKIEGEVENDN